MPVSHSASTFASCANTEYAGASRGAAIVATKRTTTTDRVIAFAILAARQRGHSAELAVHDDGQGSLLQPGCPPQPEHGCGNRPRHACVSCPRVRRVDMTGGAVRSDRGGQTMTGEQIVNPSAGARPTASGDEWQPPS